MRTSGVTLSHVTAFIKNVLLSMIVLIMSSKLLVLCCEL